MNNKTIFNHPWLPKTEPAHGGGSTAGEWQGKDQAFLGRIANDLVYEQANSRINPLPSPWSRALQMEQAILDPRYPNRKDLIEELFGCMATIGLREIIGIRIEAECVDLEAHIKQQDEAVIAFASSLTGQKPQASRALYQLQDGSHPWNNIYILKADGVVIGFTSPSTLICPTVRLSIPLPGMRWTNNHRFASPTTYLSAPQRQALADWVAHVRKGLLAAEDLHSETTVSSLSEVLTEFIDELTNGRLGNPVLSDKSVPGLPLRPKAVALLSRGAGALGTSSESVAIIELGDRRERPLPGSTNRPVVLVDPEMPSKLGIPASELTLFDTTTLEAIAGSKERLESQYGSEIEVITPDDLFASEVYLLPGEAALTNTWLLSRLEGRLLVNGTPVTPLLPLKERVRDLLSSKELEKACSMRVTSTRTGMELELRLMLQIKGLRETYPLLRSFPIKEENLIDDDLPIITLWPNVSDERWKEFYIFCEDSKSGLSVDGFSDYELRLGKEGQQSVKYFTSKRFPDLIKLIEQGRQCGLIPVNTPVESACTVTSWDVGMDFGTSFTNFFVHDGTGPDRISLETRVLPLTLAEKEHQLSLLTKFFIPEDIPPKGENPPTLTAINTYGWQPERAVIPEIYHQARIQWPSSNASAMKGAGVRTGFKWKELHYQKPFLKEIALLISSNGAAAGATTIKWSVSYPSAFSRNEARNYSQCWSSLCAELEKSTGLSHQFNNVNGVGGLQTEAVAFASYFGNYLNRPMVHTACLDVGGGTTDISLWQDNTLLHQVSIPFAGRDLCTQTIQLKPSFIRFLFTSGSAADIGNDEAKLRKDPNFNSWFDNCLRHESDDLLREKMPILRNQKEKQLIEFASIMAIGFAGIYHYLGLILQGLHKEGSLRKPSPMPVYMGGNGARFMNWLDESGCFSKGCDSDKLMQAIQGLSTGFSSADNGSAATTLSNAFKDETACGLISKGVNLKGTFDPHQDRMFAGERITINSTTFDVLDRISEPEEGTVIRYELTGMEELSRFIDNYDGVLKSLQITSLMPMSRLSKQARVWFNIKNEARAICLEHIDKKFIDLEPEPPFISGLKALTRVLAREWADRH